MTEPQPFVIDLLQQMIATQQETNTLLRRIVPDVPALSPTLYDLLLGALYRNVAGEGLPAEYAPLTGEMVRLLEFDDTFGGTAAVILAAINQRLFGLGNSSNLIAGATTDTYQLLFNELTAGGFSLNTIAQLDAIRLNTAALTNSADGSIVALLQQIADCACGDAPITGGPAPESCPLAFRQLTALEWFNPAGLELIDSAVEFAGNPGRTYDVYVMLMPQVVSTAKNVSISPVSGGAETPNTIDPRPMAYKLYGSENNVVDQYGFAVAWCGAVSPAPDGILCQIIGAGFSGLDGQVTGPAERLELLTVISDDYPSNASTGASILATSGVGVGLPGDDGTPRPSPTDNGVLDAGMVYLALDTAVYGALTASEIRTSIYLGFFEQ